MGIPLKTLEEIDHVDVAIDGADEVTEDLQVTKGKGGALFREKSVEILAKELIIIVDETKVVKKIGSKEWIPVEVAPFGWVHTSKRLSELGCIPHLRKNKGSEETYAVLYAFYPHSRMVTDNGNYILDCEFVDGIENPVEVGESIKRVVGVLEHGLFCNMASSAIIATSEGIKKFVRH